MIKLPYSTVEDVLKACGLGITVQRITELHEGDMSDADVEEMIEEFIEEADEEIQEELDIPMEVMMEVHIADGETSDFLLGPLDEEHWCGNTIENNLEEVIHVYFGGDEPKYRKFHPFPTDCDGEYTETSPHAGEWNTTVSNCTASLETTTVKCGDASIKFVFTNAGYSRFIMDNSKNINAFDYVAFAFYSSLTTPTFTLKLYNEDGDCDTQTFTVTRSGVWNIIWIKIADMTGSVDWDTDKLYEIELYSDSAVTCYMDMLNFNDGYCWAAPQGYLYIHEAENAGETPYTEGYKFYVTYTYDPYLTNTPKLVRRASKYFAGADLVEHLVGLRQSQTGFESQGESGVTIPDKETLIYNKGKLRMKGEEALRAIGYGWNFDPIRG